MNLPNFFIIGAAKSGTTALYRYIKQHPDIFMPARKEPHHFSFTEETKQTKGPGDYVRFAITDFSEYKKLFDGVSNERAIGEASPTYIYIPGTAERIASVIPNAKIIAILRHPADRAFSAYMHLVRDGYEKVLDFDEALKLESDRIANNWGPIWHYTRVGFYYEQLVRYYRVFDRDRLHVIIYDEFRKKPLEVIQGIFRFLDVNDNFVPDTSDEPNVSGVPRYQTLQKIINFFFLNKHFRSVAQKTFPDETRWRFVSYVRNLNLVRTKIPEETRQRLISLFKEDILKLQDLINYDLSFWLK